MLEGGADIKRSRLLDRFIELGLQNATALNATGMCMGLSCADCKLSDVAWSKLQARIIELSDQLDLEGIRRCLHICPAMHSAAGIHN